MRAIIGAAIALVAGFGGAANAQTIDGTAEATYGPARATQNTQTGFGDNNLGVVDFANGSELDQGFGVIIGGTLYLVIAGNLESNGNMLNVFLDTRSGGQNRLRGDNPNFAGGRLLRLGDSGGPNGLIFDSGFDADWWFGLNGFNVPPYRLFCDFSELLSAGGGSNFGFLGSNTAITDSVLSGGTNPFGVKATINNSNVVGVSGGSGTSSGAGVTTGVELAIPLAAIGNPTGPIRVCVFIANQTNSFVSNQVLGGIGGGANLGEPRGKSFAAILGDQFFTVPEENQPPVLTLPADPTIPESQTYTFTATATDPNPGQTLTYSLIGAPSGATINASSGVFTWTPSEAQGPGDYTFQIRVEDNGIPVRNDTKSLTITVSEVNQSPSLNPIPNQAIDEGQTLSFTASATDPDLPANALVYSLVGAPSGAIINPTTGVFSWTPTEVQGPGVYSFTVRVTDDGSPNLSADQTVQITVNEVNQAPSLAAVPNQAVDEGQTLSFTAVATDPDLPANTLTFSLIGAPSGASINPTTGAFSWTPTFTQAGVYTFQVRVVDDGSPILDDTENVQVTVNDVFFPGDPLQGHPIDLNGRYFAPNGFASAATAGADRVSEPGTEGTFTPFSDAAKAPNLVTVDQRGAAYQYDLNFTGWNSGASIAVSAGGLTQSVTFNGSNFVFAQPGGTQTDGSTATAYRVFVQVSSGGVATTTVVRLNGDQAGTSFAFAPESASGMDAASFQVAATGGASANATTEVSGFTTSALPNSLYVFADDPYQLVGQDTTYRLGMANLTRGVRGYQTFLQALAGQPFVSGTYTNTPFPQKIIDPITNVLDLAAGVNLGDPAVLVNAKLAEIVLNGASAGATGLQFRVNTPPTRFVDQNNQALTPTTTNSNVVIVDGTLPTITNETATQPGSGNLFGGGAVEQGVLSIAFDAFDGGVAPSGLTSAPSVTIQYASGGPQSLPVFHGAGDGFIAQTTIGPSTPNGPATVTIVAIDDAGNQRTIVRTIEINVARVVIALTAQGLGGVNVTREVRFTVGGSGSGAAPIQVAKNVEFNGGAATVILDASDGLIPGEAYTVVSAKDPRHTLRKRENLTGGANAQFSASIAMRSGDANDDNVIDIVDYGVLAEQFGQNVGGANTPIGFTNGFGGLHADFTGDGLVTTPDVTFIVAAGQFLSLGDNEAGSLGWRLPQKRATVREMMFRGVRRAPEMDLNRDGWVEVEEISGWLFKRR
jgi:hypothetical protein